MSRLANLEQEERALKNAYLPKLRTTDALPSLQEQVLREADDLHALQQRLTASDDRSLILGEIADLAQQQGLKFELARPVKTEIATQYRTHAVGIRLSGRYHDLGRFAAAITALTTIVVLQDLQLSAADDGVVSMDALALTYQLRTENRDLRALNALAKAPPASTATHAFIYEADADSAPFGRPQPKTPEIFNRRPTQRAALQALELFPLESIQMIGTISQEGRRHVLLQVDKLVYQARTGDYAGKNFGVIRHISEREISLEELLPGTDGRWETRVATLTLRGVKQ